MRMIQFSNRFGLFVVVDLGEVSSLPLTFQTELGGKCSIRRMVVRAAPSPIA